MSDYKHMFELKQTDWIDACKQIDALQAELAAANATIDRYEKQEIHEAMECHKAHEELAGLKDYSVKLADKLSLCQHQLAQTRALLAVQRGALEVLRVALNETTEAFYVHCTALGNCRLLDPDRFTKEQLVAHIEYQNKFVDKAFKDAPRWNFQNEALDKIKPALASAGTEELAAIRQAVSVCQQIVDYHEDPQFALELLPKALAGLKKYFGVRANDDKR